jgi:hypothetical protein
MWASKDAKCNRAPQVATVVARVSAHNRRKDRRAKSFPIAVDL